MNIYKEIEKKNQKKGYTMIVIKETLYVQLEVLKIILKYIIKMKSYIFIALIVNI